MGLRFGRSWSNRSPCQSTDGLEMKREKKTSLTRDSLENTSKESKKTSMHTPVYPHVLSLFA